MHLPIYASIYVTACFHTNTHGPKHRWMHTKTDTLINLYVQEDT